MVLLSLRVESSTELGDIPHLYVFHQSLPATTATSFVLNSSEALERQAKAFSLRQYPYVEVVEKPEANHPIVMRSG